MTSLAPQPPPQPPRPPRKTVRILLISDTHALTPIIRPPFPESAWDLPTLPPYVDPLPSADIAIHCGDLTKSLRLSKSHLPEYASALSLLKSMPAPLKIAIPGNHDLALDRRYSDPRRGKELAAVRALMASAAEEGVHLLVEEGRYDFILENGCVLRIYASPWTPNYGSWAFQYDTGDGHVFEIGKGVDVAVTHGPPRGVLDWTRGGQMAGCEHLLARTAEDRPRVHCFGHIHEGWGAEIVRWEEGERVMVETLETVQGTRGDSKEVRAERVARRNEWIRRHGGRLVDATGIKEGRETLFVNAAVVDVHYKPVQLPWLVDLDLPVATEEDVLKARETDELLARYRREARAAAGGGTEQS